MAEWISTKDRLPEDGKTVLIFDGSVNVAKFERGISKEEREKMKRGEIDDPIHTGWNVANGYFEVKRSDSYCRADEQGNNLVPYCWVGHCSPMTWFGQYVSHWMPIPDKPDK